MKVVYESADGKQFGSENDCLMHEAALGITDLMLFDEAFVMLNKDYEEVSDIANAELLYVIQLINGDVEPIRQFVRRSTGAGWIGEEPGLYMLDINNTWRLVNAEIRDTRRILESLQELWLDVYTLLPGLLKNRGKVMPNDAT